MDQYVEIYHIKLTSKLNIVNFKKRNRDRKKLLKQDEDTGNDFYYI